MEFVPEPPSGRVYETELTAGLADVVGSGRARLDAIARWLQDGARDDLVDAGFEGRGVWIVRRTRFQVSAFPRYGERLTLRTFCSGLGRFSAERRTSFTAGGEPRVEAVSRWICMEPDGSRPQRLEGEFREAYAESAGDRDANVRVRHPDPPQDAPREPWAFRATDIDIAAHVNNSHYWAPIEQDWLGATEPEGFDGEIEHREPALAEEAALVHGEGMSWVVGAGGEVHASLLYL